MDGAANRGEAHGSMKNSGGGRQESKERVGLSQTVREGAGHVPGLRPTSPLGTEPLGKTDAACTPQPSTQYPGHWVPMGMPMHWDGSPDPTGLAFWFCFLTQPRGSHFSQFAQITHPKSLLFDRAGASLLLFAHFLWRRGKGSPCSGPGQTRGRLRSPMPSAISLLCPPSHQPWPHVLPSLSPHLRHPMGLGHPWASMGVWLQPQSIRT